MNYIVHRRFKGKALCGEFLNIPYGTELILDGDFLKTKDNKLICAVNSENAKIHFSDNTDGKGLLRGKLTYAIAYSKKGMTPDGGFRFTEKQRNIIIRHYQRFLNPEHDFIIFNNKFFSASVDELKEMAAELKITV